MVVFTHGNETHESSYRQRQSTQQDALDPLFVVERHRTDKITTKGDEEVLCDTGKEQNGSKEWIICEALEYVHFVTNATGVDFIEDLAQHKSIEDNGEMGGGVRQHGEVLGTGSE